MPGAYGGGSNPPVRLDPWQEIIEVGWNSITHVAFLTGISIKDVEVIQGDTACSPETGLLVEDGEGGWYPDGFDPDFDVLGNSYLKEFTYTQEDEFPSELISVYTRRSNGEWDESGSTGEISGVPEMPGPIDLPEWKYFEWINEGPFQQEAYPSHNKRFLPINGNPEEGNDPAEDAINVPGFFATVGDAYFGPPNAEHEMSGWEFIADTHHCWGDAGNFLIPVEAAIYNISIPHEPSHAPDELPGWEETKIEYDVSSIVVRLNGKGYRGIGAYAELYSQTLMVLCERSPLDDQPPDDPEEP